MDKNYITKKIINCLDLINNATSDAQREVYQGYLELWQKRLEKSTPPLKDVVEYDDDITDEAKYKLEFPNRKAYYTKDGNLQKTRGFTEFLKSLE